MKIVSAILLTAFLAYVVGIYTAMPWWIFAITSLLVSLAIPQRPGRSFLCGFTALFLLWAILAFRIDVANDHLLSGKVAHILPMGGSYVVLIIVTGIIGGLVSGLAALTGSYLRNR